MEVSVGLFVGLFQITAVIAKIILLLFSMFKNKPGTADVLRSTEMFALQAAIRLPREDMAEPTVTDNISELNTIKHINFV